jgi:hypothetical protein
MVTVEDVKSGMVRFVDETANQITAIRGVAASIDHATAMLAALGSGSGHPLVGDALGRLVEARRKLDEATRLVASAVDATRSYAAGI